MGYPADVATVTLNGLFGAALPTASIPTGYVEIWPNTVLVDSGTGEIIETAKITAALDGTGAFSVVLMATDDTHITPSGWAYWVREVIDGYALRVYQVKVPTGGPYKLGALQQLSVPATSPYVLQSQVGAANGVASLDVNGQVPASQLANAAGGGGGSGVPSGTVITETGYGQAPTAGAAATYSRGDHTHGSPALGNATPAAETIGAAGAVGTGTAPARSDHVHAMPTAAAPGASAVGDAAAAGASASVARADHVHGREAFGAVTAGTSYAAASANGSAVTVAHSDHQHGTPPVPFVIAPFGVRGAVAVVVGAARVYNDSGRTLTILSVRSSVGTAPTGASLIVDINVNGTTIFTTQANRPTIAISGFTSGKITNMDVTTIADGSYFTVDVDQVGSTIAGSDLTVQIAVV